MDPQGTNVQPPAYTPTWPTWPPLDDLVRVTGGPAGATADGKRVYPAFIQQFAPPLSLRDRVAAFVLEANNLFLQPGVYDCRLIGAYPPGAANPSPLYCTTCCPTSASSSSAAPGH